MKKYISLFASLVAVLAVASCQKDKYGAVSGNDSNPFVVVNVYAPELPADPDCDAFVRVAANNVTAELYFFAEPVATKEARNLPEAEYPKYVIEHGKKISDTYVNEFDGTIGAEFVEAQLYGKNILSVVAVGKNGASHIASQEFFGLKWTTVATGTYSFSKPAAFATVMGSSSMTGVELQRSDDNPDNYRFKNLFGPGKSLNIVVYPKYTATDDGGTYTFFRVPAQPTGHSYGSYGEVSIRDIGYWQGDDSYVFESGMESGMYEDYNCFIEAQLYVSEGSLGYGYSFFIPDSK